MGTAASAAITANEAALLRNFIGKLSYFGRRRSNADRSSAKLYGQRGRKMVFHWPNRLHNRFFMWIDMSYNIRHLRGDREAIGVT